MANLSLPNNSFVQTRPRTAHESAVESLLADCLERPEEKRQAALEELCKNHPTEADELRSRFEILLAIGLVATSAGEEKFPEVLGDFRLIRRLGSGGMGVVYLAEQQSLSRDVALKLIRPQHLYFPGALERFYREAEAIARLKHPNIVPIHAVGLEEDIPFLVMEWIEGSTLSAILETCQGQAIESRSGHDFARAIEGSDGAPPTAFFAGGWNQVCFRVIAQVTSALAHAHAEGVVHRDIKPSNIMVRPDGRVLLMDFGLAQTSDSTRLTRSHSQPGSPAYMSPEQLDGQSVEAATDVYSTGVTLYELLTGRLPFRTSSQERLRNLVLEGNYPPIRDSNPSVTWEAETVCAKAMDLDPRLRYASAADLAEDVDNVLALRPIKARRSGPALRTRRWIQRRPAATLAILLALLLLVGVPITLLVMEKAASGQIRTESRRADENLIEALKVVDRLLTRVGDEALAYVPRAEKLRHSLLADAAAFYESFLAREGGSTRIEAEKAWVEIKLGRLILQMGQAQEGLARIDNALPSLRTYSTDHPDDEAARDRLRRARLERATALRAVGRGSERHAELEAALAEDPLLPRDHPWAFRSALTTGILKLDQALSTSSDLGSLKASRTEGAVRLLRRLHEQDPDNITVLGYLATAENELTIWHSSHRNLKEARRHAKKSLELHARLADMDHASPGSRSRHVRTLMIFAWSLAKVGDESAITVARDALKAAEEIEQDFPGLVSLHSSTSHALARLGFILLEFKRPQEARPWFDRAITANEQRLKRGDTSMQTYMQLLTFRQTLGQSLVSTHPRLAREYFLRALEDHRALRKHFPGTQMGAKRVTMAIRGIAESHQQEGNLQEALRGYARVVKRLQKALERRGPDPEISKTIEDIQSRMVAMKRKASKTGQ